MAYGVEANAPTPPGYLPFRADALLARLAKLPLGTWPPLLLAVTLWIRAASDLVIGALTGALGGALADIAFSYDLDCRTA